ncbi:MAG: hypothetical protein ACJ77B_03390 [Chloroflexota bacterium]
MRVERATAVIVAIELVLLAGLGLLWLTRQPENPLVAQAYGLQPWAPYAAIAFGLLTLLVLVRWVTWRARRGSRARVALGVLLVVMLAVGGYAFRQWYLEVPATTGGPVLP